MERLKDFNILSNGDLIISLIDNEVTEFKIFDGDKYLCSNKSMFPLFQFEASDFYMYNGNKQVGEKDEEYFKTIKEPLE